MFSAFFQQAQDLAASGMEPDGIVLALKAAGASQMETVAALKKLGYSLPEADKLVLYHPVWAESLATNTALRESVDQAVDVLVRWDAIHGKSK